MSIQVSLPPNLSREGAKYTTISSSFRSQPTAVCAARTPRRQQAGCPADRLAASPDTAAFSCRGNKQPNKPSPTIPKTLLLVSYTRQTLISTTTADTRRNINTVTSQKTDAIASLAPPLPSPSLPSPPFSSPLPSAPPPLPLLSSSSSPHCSCTL